MKKRLLLLMLALILLPAAALALDPADESFSTDFKELPAVIGAVSVPEHVPAAVRSAPFENAWLPEDWNALPPDTDFRLLGTLQGQSWVLAAFQGNDGSEQVGWIAVDPERCAALTDDHEDLVVNRTLCRVTREIPATDEPLGTCRTVRMLAEGETVIAVFALNEDWLCVETLMDGQTAWLFTDPRALEEVPLITVEGNVIRLGEEVTFLGSLHSVDWIPQHLDDEGRLIDDAYYIRTLIRPGDVSGGYINFSDDEEIPWDADFVLTLPENFRHLGEEAIVHSHLAELRLPASLEDSDSFALYGCTIDRMVFTAGCTADEPGGEYVTVGAYEAEEGNPRYASRDGVLFSADGKTLIRYPNGREDTHYDVPAGVETIARWAFSDDLMGIPLKTVSLPIGLRRIEDGAFNGCGRLQSLTVPLTVTELAEDAFENCVSLERLSLPPGLRAGISQYVERADFTWYSGDNGATEQYRPKRNAETGFTDYYAWIDNAAGEGREPLYSSPAFTTVLQELPVGERVRVDAIRFGAAGISIGYGSDAVKGWLPADRLKPAADRTLFNITGAIDRQPGKRYDEYELEFENGVLMLQDSWDEDGSAKWKACPREDSLLLRSGSGDRELARLCAAKGTSVRIFDAPEGTEQAHTYDGDQAIVLERRDGWARVRTLSAEGWVKESDLWLTEPKTADP